MVLSGIFIVPDGEAGGVDSGVMVSSMVGVGGITTGASFVVFFPRLIPIISAEKIERKTIKRNVLRCIFVLYPTPEKKEEISVAFLSLCVRCASGNDGNISAF
jgi:hypothetical protein